MTVRNERRASDSSRLITVQSLFRATGEERVKKRREARELGRLRVSLGEQCGEGLARSGSVFAAVL
jgi:hypothetical protein